MYVHKLKISNWKNFREGEVDLTRRLFLIGPNASGKSNFLDIFRFLRDICLPAGGGFRQAVESRGGVSAIRSLAARQYSDITIDVSLKEERGTNELWRYRLSFNQDNLRIPKIKEEIVENNGALILKRPDEGDKKDELRLTQTALEQIKENTKFRTISEFFLNVNYQHLLPQAVRDPQAFSPKPLANDPFGRDFLQRVAKTPERSRNSRLKKILEALKVAAPQLKTLEVNRDDSGVPHLEGLFEHWRPKAGKQNEAQFSDGTLRLFGLLWTLFEGKGLLLMEEPELSLHTEVVRLLPQLIERVQRHLKVKRQIIISTHSEVMLQDEGIGSEEVLILEPSPQGTQFEAPSKDSHVREQLAAGLTIGDVVFPKSSPKNPEQMVLPFK